MILNYRGFGQTSAPERVTVADFDRPARVALDGRATVPVQFPSGEMLEARLVYNPFLQNAQLTVEFDYKAGPGIKAATVQMKPGQVPGPVVRPPSNVGVGETVMLTDVFRPEIPPIIDVLEWATPRTPTVADAQPTGETTTVDMPGIGPTPLPVYRAPIARAEIVPGPQGTPIVVIPMDQPSNLPVAPTLTASGVKTENGVVTFPPEIWKMYFEIPKYRRNPAIEATEEMERAARAATGASAANVSTDLLVVEGGVTDAEGRFYPTTTPAGGQQIVTSSAGIVAAGGGSGDAEPRSKLPWAIAAVAAAYFVWRQK